MLAKDASATLGACLKSIRPFVSQIVVGVDERSDAKTYQVARRNGADIVRPVKVADWHECQWHGRVMAQDFARARNETFAWLDRGLDWWGWVDSDDVLEGGQQLTDVLASVPPEIGTIWFPYIYSWTRGANGKIEPNTLFDRERLLRVRHNGNLVPWEWRHRVHEVIVPGDLALPILRTDTLQLIHQEGAHKTNESAGRNLLLLEIDLEQNPNDERTLFYLGNQHFAMGNWPQAIAWYSRLTAIGKNPYELWQSFVYLSKAYIQVGDVQAAMKAALGALTVRPEHPEPYFQAADCSVHLGQWEQAVFWTQLGRQMKPPPFFVFKNPLDYSYNHRLPLADALAQLGRVTEAKRELEAAHAIVPVPAIEEGIERHRQTEQNAAQASAFVAMARGLDDAGRIRLWETLDLPPDVRRFGRCRDVVMPAYLRQRPNTQPRVVFWCGQSIEPWAPPSLTTTGIGGSETAVIEIARRFDRDGWRVDVFNSADQYEGVYDGVGYWDAARLASEQVDLLVGWRQATCDGLPLQARARVAWLHDLSLGPDVGRFLAGWDRVLGVSAWHARHLQRAYDLPTEQVGFVPNGIDLSRFDPTIRKVPFSCVYASSPDRGLRLLLSLWPKILAKEPAATLHVAYGWQGFDYLAQRGHPELNWLRHQIEEQIAALPSVTWHGRLPQDELAKLYGRATAWLYPSNFLEVSCISAMEAMAAGAVPVCSSVGALSETVGDAGFVVPGPVHSKAWQEFYLHVAMAVLTESTTRWTKLAAATERAKLLTWDRAYEYHWRPLVAGLLEAPARELQEVA